MVDGSPVEVNLVKYGLAEQEQTTLPEKAPSTRRLLRVHRDRVRPPTLSGLHTTNPLYLPTTTLLVSLRTPALRRRSFS